MSLKLTICKIVCSYLCWRYWLQSSSQLWSSKWEWFSTSEERRLSEFQRFRCCWSEAVGFEVSWSCIVS